MHLKYWTTHYGEIAAEFRNVHDLLAAILAKNVLKQLKQGLLGEIHLKFVISVLRGRLDIERLIIGCREKIYYVRIKVLSVNNIFNC